MAERLDQKPAATSVSNTDILLVAHPSTGAMKKATLAQVAYKNTLLSLTDGGVINWDFATGNMAEVTLGGNRTLNMSNVPENSFGVLKVKQDATGSRTLSLPGNLETGLALSTGANQEDILGFMYVNSTFYWTISKFGTTTGGGGSYDSDAQAFFTATGISDTGQKDAINDFVLALKAASIWTKMKAIYPFVGGTATTHKYNLKDPQDTDAAYRLTFTNITHSANGVTGASGFCHTHLNPSLNLTINSSHIAAYLRTAAVGTEFFAAADNGSNGYFQLAFAAGTLYNRQYQATANGQVAAAASGTTGCFIGSRSSSSALKSFKNGTQLGTTTAATDGVLVNQPVYLCANNSNGTAANFSTQQMCFACIGDGLSDAEVTALNTAIVALQIDLGRNV